MKLSRKIIIIMLIHFVVILIAQNCYLHWLLKDKIENKIMLAYDYAELAATDLEMLLQRYQYATGRECRSLLRDTAFQTELGTVLSKQDIYSIGYYREGEEDYFLTVGEIRTPKVDLPFSFQDEKLHVVIDRDDRWNIISEVGPIAVAVYLVGITWWLCVLLVFMKQQNDRRVLVERGIHEAKMEFFSNMSHDMRTPLNGIIGFTEINLAHAGNVQLQKENQERVLAAARYLKALINNVLDIGSWEIERPNLEPTAFELVQVCEECHSMVQAQAHQLGLTMHLEQPEWKEIHVIGYPVYVKEILINLYSNAMKYNRAQGSISVRMRELDRSRDVITCEFRIEDTGVGMTEEFVQHQLFGACGKESGRAQLQFPGTGLGMAIVKELVDQMDGSIQVKSEPEVGTVVTVCIPFAIDSEYEGQTQEKAEEADIAGLRILLVDDVALNLEMEDFVLSEYGAIVTTAVNGKEAYEIFMREPAGSFDVILMDLLMPVMNGYEATLAIRSSGQADARTIPIIAVTANAFSSDVEKCLRVGMNAHVAKPFDKKVAFQVIHDLTERYNMQIQEAACEV